MLARLRGEMLSPERALPDQQLERGDGQRVAVARLRGRLPEDLLWSDVGGGTQHLPARTDRVLRREPRDPEVGDMQDALAVEQHVDRLDVAVDHAVAVGVVERGGRFVKPPHGLLARHRPHAQRVGDGSARQELHHDERPAQRRVAIDRPADVVDRHDVAVARQSRRGPCLATKA